MGDFEMKGSNKTKICKYCKSEIAADAKICPHCRKSQGGKVKWIVLGIVGFFVLAAIIGGGSNQDSEKAEVAASTSAATEAAETTVATDNAETTAETEKATEKATEAAKDSFGIGDTADFNGIQVRLSSVRTSNGDGQFLSPEDGKCFLGLVFDIDNQSSHDIGVSSLISFEAYCDDYTVNQDILGLQIPEWKGIGQLDGNVAAGKKMSGVICYQVPKDFTSFEIRYSPSFWGNKKATFVFTRADVEAQAR